MFLLLETKSLPIEFMAWERLLSIHLRFIKGPNSLGCMGNKKQISYDIETYMNFEWIQDMKTWFGR